jgi:transcriptional regulator GlxA family with amidase domain
VPAERYRQVVERVDAAVRANAGRLFGVSALSRVIKVTPRTLARAVRAIHGTTPTRYLRVARLNLARQALFEPHTGEKTVTEVAMRFGFHEVGRFAGEYRAACRENPSETLRRSLTNR